MTALKLNNQLHAIKIEDLVISRERADDILEVITDFCRDVGFSSERIEPLDCRASSGFSPYSHNKGGLGCVSFMDQYSAHCNGTGFDNTDATLEKYQEYTKKHRN